MTLSFNSTTGLFSYADSKVSSDRAYDFVRCSARPDEYYVSARQRADPPVSFWRGPFYYPRLRHNQWFAAGRAAHLRLTTQAGEVGSPPRQMGRLLPPVDTCARVPTPSRTHYTEPPSPRGQSPCFANDDAVSDVTDERQEKILTSLYGMITNMELATRAPLLERAFFRAIHLLTLRTTWQFTTYMVDVISEMSEGTLHTYLTDILLGKAVPDIEVQAGEPVHEQARIGFGSCLDHFQALRHTELGGRVRKIFALIFMAGMLGKDPEKDYPGIYKRVIAAEGVHKMDGFDITEEILNTVRTVWDVVATCVTERNFGPLLGSTVKLQVMQATHAKLMSRLDYFMNGTYARVCAEGGVPAEPATYIFELATHTLAVQEIQKRNKEKTLIGVYAKMLLECSVATNKVREQRTRLTSRRSPFGALFSGRTGVGKSIVAATFLRDAMRIADLPYSNEYIAWVNTAESFMTTVTNYTLGVIMDDVANTKAECQKTDELINIIRISNTACTPVEKADLADKGTVFHNCQVFVATTNIKDLQAPKLSVDPSAILRRFDIHVEVRAKEFFSTATTPRDLPMLDPSKFDQGIYTRSQLFHVCTLVPLRVTEEQGGAAPQNEWRLVPGLDEWVEYGVMMKHLAPRIRNHFGRQAEYLEQVEADARLPLCEHGYTTAPNCVECALHVQSGEHEVVPLQPPPPRRAGSSFWSLFSVPGSPSDDEFEVLEQLPPGSAADPIEALVYGPQEAERRYAAQAAEQNSRGARLRKSWDDFWNPVCPAPSAPKPVLWWDALTTGRFPVEDLFMRNPTTFMTCVAGILPAIASGVITGGASVIWAFNPITLFSAYTVMSLGIVYTISHSVIAYAKGRVAGMPAQVIREHLTKIATRRLAVIMTGVIVSLGAVAITAGLLARGREKEKKEVAPGAVSPTVIVVPASAPPLPPTVAPDVAAIVPPEVPAAREIDNSAFTCPEEKMSTQGGQVSVPDPVKRHNEWISRPLVCTHFPSDPHQRTATREQTLAKIQRQLFVVTIQYANSCVVTQAWMICTNYALMPYHNFVRESGEFGTASEMTFTSTGANRGATFKCRVCPTLVQRIGCTDLAVVYVGVGGTLCDLRGYLSDAPDAGDEFVEELSRVRDGVQDYLIATERYVAKPGEVACAVRGWKYRGFSYQRNSTTFQGLCGAILVTAGQFPRVIGMHTMGRDGDTEGRAVRLYAADVTAAILAVRARGYDAGPPVSMASTDLFVPDGMERSAEIGELSGRSLLRETQPGTSFIPLGTLVNHVQNKPRTRLTLSPYSAMVTECTHEECTTAPNPTYGRSVNFKRRVDEMGSITQIDPGILLKACEDYRDELRCIIRVIPNVRALLRPLTESEVLSGVVGCSSINAMNMNTARGFPFSGNKHTIYEWRESWGEIYRLATPAFQAELRKAEAILARGERANFVFNSNQKDEAKKIGATKCRVFEACPTPLIVLTRKYFLPVVRIFSMFPLQTESAVGINASGPEWDALAQHLREYSTEKVMAKDWKGFDTSQAYQESKSAMSLLIWIAETYGGGSDGAYGPTEIAIMWGLAEEICRYIAMFLSDVRMNDGSNSSGNALTVVINNIVHSHRDRAAFYGLWERHLAANPTAVLPTRRTDATSQVVAGAGQILQAGYRGALPPLSRGLNGRFADYVRLMCYGDDSLETVRSEVEPFFNQVAYAAWYKEQGKVVTAADKTEVVDHFGTWGDVTFLKRQFRYDEELQRFMAPLEMASIYKPMHVWPKTLVLGPEVQLATLIDNAARELYQHGRQVVEHRAPGLAALATMAGVRGYLQCGFVPEFDHFMELERKGVLEGSIVSDGESE